MIKYDLYMIHITQGEQQRGKFHLSFRVEEHGAMASLLWFTNSCVHIFALVFFDASFTVLAACFVLSLFSLIVFVSLIDCLIDCFFLIRSPT